MAYSKYNIAIIPPENIRELAREVSSQFTQNAYFTLNDGDIIPHLSLYHIPLARNSVDEANAVLEKTIQKFSSFEITGKEYYSHLGGWVGISYEKSARVISLEERVLDILEDLWCREFAHENEDVGGEKGKNIQKFGWVDAGSRFFPHITLSRLKNENDRSAKQSLEKYIISHWSFSVERVGLFELGEHGTCTKLLKTFYLTRA